MKLSLNPSQERSLLLTLAAVQFTYVMEFIIMAPLGPQLLRIFAITPQQFAFIASAYAISAGMTSLLASLVVDRFDRKRIVTLAYIGFLLGTLGCALAPEYWSFLTARTLTGAFGGILGSQIFAIIGDVIPFERRGRGTAVVTASFALASVLGVPVGLTLANAFGWHAPFWGILVLGGVAIVFIFAFVPNITEHLYHGAERNPFASLTETLTNPNQRTAVMMLVALVLSQFTVIFFVAQYMVANVGLGESALPVVYFIGGIASAFSSPLIGKMVDKFGSGRVLMLTAAISLPVFVIVTTLPPVPVAVALVVTTLLFIFMGGRMIPAMALVNSTVLPHRRGGFLSVINASQQLAGALGALIAGAVLVKLPNGHLQNYPYLGAFSAALTLVVIVLTRNIRIIEQPNNPPSNNNVPNDQVTK